VLIHHLPNFLKERFVQFLTFDWIDYFNKHWLIVVISIIIGAYSHLFFGCFYSRMGIFC
ncbi:MAG TPA: DUF4184 domain-containing protein, partial [Flavobacteriaceae bacterium]|nr:DUF4184 domain-containing protein [Flavobacteriaceae bacterium]